MRSDHRSLVLSPDKAVQLQEELEDSTRGLSDQVPVSFALWARPSARSKRDQVPVAKSRDPATYEQGRDQVPVNFFKE